MENMTALVSAFARAYHYSSSAVYVFSDAPAVKLLTAEEYAGISQSMSRGIGFFAPGFEGTPEEALRFIVDRQLAPSVLARSAFCERAIENAVKLGCGQIVLFASGYDTFALRTSHRALTVFELDRPEMIADKRARVARSGLQPACRVAYVSCDLSRPGWRDALIDAGYNADKTCFASLLGISYYLSKPDFARLIGDIASLCPEGSSLCMDYPMSEDGESDRRNRALAEAAGEPMKARYARDELEAMLAKAGFLIHEHLGAREADEAFFSACNRENPEHPMAAPKGVGYCLAVKR